MATTPKPSEAATVKAAAEQMVKDLTTLRDSLVVILPVLRQAAAVAADLAKVVQE